MNRIALLFSFVGQSDAEAAEQAWQPMVEHLKNVTGKKGKELYEDWQESLGKRYEIQLEPVYANPLPPLQWLACGRKLQASS